MTEAERRADANRTVGPEDVRVWEDDLKVLHVSVRGETFDDVRPVHVFPISAKADYVSFLDESDKEVALLKRPDGLPAADRETLNAALERMYYVPRITRVDSITETWGISHWKVQTDRGYASFEVVARENIRKLPGGRLIIGDADGNRFEIEDLSRLDPRSQALIHSET